MFHLVSIKKNEEGGRVSYKEQRELESGRGGGAARRGCRENTRRRQSGSIKIETKIMAIRQDAEIRMVPAAILLQLLPLVVSLKL